MKIIRNNKGIETLIFAETFEQEAYDQIKELINLEAYEYAKIRIMPDAHAGRGCTVGTTMVITDKITPNLVGVDIGCGMLTVRLKDKKIDFSKLDDTIKTKIPSGFNIREKHIIDFDFGKLVCRDSVDLCRAMLSIGTLGGGNHFIEVGTDDINGCLHLIIHSGSRKLGNDVCKYYQDKAISQSKKITNKTIEDLIYKLKSDGRYVDIYPEIKNIQKLQVNKDLAFICGDDFANYMNDMAIVQQFASLNRNMMAEIIIKELGLHEDSRFETIHNYIDFKRMILRKGAVSAENGEILIIPINMRDGSLLCIGKGNDEWNYSAPHGAGRLMSRKKAKENISISEFEAYMSGIYTTSVTTETIDEAPQAYKPIDEIMASIVDTVDIIGTIKPLYNYKAH
jgi:RNA-splicing ligase RtcB